ncbi:hypothetical protein CW304_10555 [Bacillus sp. UFRGS-B20]|nr:hypothetical protein CW304_10555 [Bacillus sp. UFRGS-B20]
MFNYSSISSLNTTYLAFLWITIAEWHVSPQLCLSDNYITMSALSMMYALFTTLFLALPQLDLPIFFFNFLHQLHIIYCWGLQ